MPASRIGRFRLLALLIILAVIAYVYRAECYFYLSRAPVLYYLATYRPQEGDVVFQSLPHSEVTDAIEGVTKSPYSHCGVVLRDNQNRWVVIESIISVRETPLALWMLRGRGGNFAAYRLNPKYAPLIPQFKQALLSYLSRPYDFDYDMTNERSVYCSDLVYLAFEKTTGEKMGTLEKLGDLDWKPYESFIRSDQSGLLPLDRVMITPASLSRAPQLYRVE
jgi:hypothetical protein